MTARFDDFKKGTGQSHGVEIHFVEGSTEMLVSIGKTYLREKGTGPEIPLALRFLWWCVLLRYW